MDQGLVDQDGQDDQLFTWNWDTLTEAATSVPYTALGDPSVHTATSAASAVGDSSSASAAGDTYSLPHFEGESGGGTSATMEVDAESVVSQPPVQPAIPKGRPKALPKAGSHRSRLLDLEGGTGSAGGTQSQ